jgi:hypothetical protein
LDGGNTVALCARGEILTDLGEARQAMLDLDRVSLAGRPAIRAARGLALAKLGDQAGSNAEVDDALTEAPRNGDVLFYAAQAKALNGDENTAGELASLAADASDPALPPYHRDVALQLALEHGRTPGQDSPGPTSIGESAPSSRIWLSSIIDKLVVTVKRRLFRP